MLTVAALFVAAQLAPAAPPPPAAPPKPGVTVPEHTTRALSFTDDKGNAYDAVLTMAARERSPAGVSVMLIGGGSVTDEHWTIPPSVELEGKLKPFTIDGKATRDADTIAAALVQAGFVVMQWSSIRRDDPERLKNPALATAVPYAESVELSRRALRLLREQPEVDPRRVALVGHSLGATRAWQIADDGIIAIVSLSGAYTSRVRESPRGLADEAWAGAKGADSDGDGLLSEKEFDAWRAPPPNSAPTSGAAFANTEFSTLDRDKDGAVRAWELAAAAKLIRLDAGDASVLDSKPMFRGDLPWPIDRAAALDTPWLACFGGLDPISIHGPMIERWTAEQGEGRVTVEYVAGVGHQMGPEKGELTGPISEAVVRRVVEWLRDIVRE